MDMEFWKPIIAGQVRHYVGILGGVLIGLGWMKTGDSSAFTEIMSGLVMGAAAALWSWWQKIGQKRALELLKKAKAPAAKAALILFCVLIVARSAHAALFGFPDPAPVQAQPAVHVAKVKHVRHVRHQAVVPLPTPDPRTIAGLYDATRTPTAKSGQFTPQQIQTDPLAFLRQFSINDIQNAILLAQAQNPPDQTSLMCWQGLLPIVQSLSSISQQNGGTATPATGTTAATTGTTTGTTTPAPTVGNPLAPGAATLIQDARDAKALAASLSSSSGPLAAINQACAPLVIDINTTLVLLGVQGGIAVAGGPAAGSAAGALGIGGITALQGILSKFAIPLPTP